MIEEKPRRWKPVVEREGPFDKINVGMASLETDLAAERLGINPPYLHEQYVQTITDPRSMEIRSYKDC